MSASTRYAGAGARAVGAIVLVLWPFLDAEGRSGVLTAAAVALPIQVAAFAALVRYRGRATGFMTVWAGGTLVRMAALLVVGLLAFGSAAEGTVVMLLALAGFFFGLLLLEPIYFRVAPSDAGPGVE